jgi:hypothetical protein
MLLKTFPLSRNFSQVQAPVPGVFLRGKDAIVEQDGGLAGADRFPEMIDDNGDNYSQKNA